jgi:hypothetical protein
MALEGTSGGLGRPGNGKAKKMELRNEKKREVPTYKCSNMDKGDLHESIICICNKRWDF